MFGWGGVAKGIENIASEWIETNQEKAEARAVMVRALDPNGAMRRDISTTVRSLYAVYIMLICVLVMCQAFDLSTVVKVDDVSRRSVDIAVDSLTELFAPITALFGIIVTASFGVNAVNSSKGK
jgi:hypothetical protein